MDDGELVELAEGCTSRSTICTTAGVPFPGLTPSMMPQDILGQPNPNEPTNHEVDHCRRSWNRRLHIRIVISVDQDWKLRRTMHSWRPSKSKRTCSVVGFIACFSCPAVSEFRNYFGSCTNLVSDPTLLGRPGRHFPADGSDQGQDQGTVWRMWNVPPRCSIRIETFRPIRWWWSKRTADVIWPIGCLTGWTGRQFGSRIEPFQQHWPANWSKSPSRCCR